MKKGKEVAVMVTTDKRGVFFGYTDQAKESKVMTLKRARNCIYWHSSVKGFMGLAATGPNGNCKIGPSVPEITLHGIESVCQLTPDAVAAWEKAPWA